METKEVTTGRLTINLPGIVAEARARNRPPKYLVQSFENMPLAIAKDLLDGLLDMNPDGTVTATGKERSR